MPQNQFGFGDFRPINLYGTNSTSKKSCPKTIRDQLRVKWWKGKYEGPCFCCGRKISYEHVECGRIKAGGKYSVPNTRLICKTCNELSGKYKDICINEVSEVSTDPSICQKGNEGCLVNVYTNLVIQTKDPSYCYNLSARYKCLTAAAVILKDQKLCDDIDVGLTEKDYPLAGDRTPKYVCKEWVVRQIAIDSNDVTACNEFEFKGGKYSEPRVSKGICIDGAAQCNKNDKLCDSHDNEEYKESCKNSINSQLPRTNGPSDNDDSSGLVCNLIDVVRQ